MLKSWQKCEEKLSKKNKHDINVVYDEPPESPSALEVNRAFEVLQQLTLFWGEGGFEISFSESQQVFAKNSDSKAKKANNHQ